MYSGARSRANYGKVVIITFVGDRGCHPFLSNILQAAHATNNTASYLLVSVPRSGYSLIIIFIMIPKSSTVFPRCKETNKKQILKNVEWKGVYPHNDKDRYSRARLDRRSQSISVEVIVALGAMQHVHPEHYILFENY